MTPDAASWIDRLGLLPHPEGGFFAETYRSREIIGAAALPARFRGSRHVATAGYFLLPGDEFSSFHRLRADEVWHFYCGCDLDLFVLDDGGRLTTHLLGSSGPGCLPQVMVPWGTWIAARPRDPASYALVGCTVSPGFDLADFELAARDEMLRLFPSHRDLIISLTRISPEGRRWST